MPHVPFDDAHTVWQKAIVWRIMTMAILLYTMACLYVFIRFY